MIFRSNWTDLRIANFWIGIFCGWSYIGAVLNKVTSTQEKRRLIFLFLFRVETASLSTTANGARPFRMLVCLLIIRMDQFMRDRRKSEAGFRHSVTSVETSVRVAKSCFRDFDGVRVFHSHLILTRGKIE